MTREVLEKIIGAMDPKVPRDARDISILTVGYVTALRGDNIVVLNYEDVRTYPDGGLALFIAKSKTDQEARGTLVGLDALGDDDPLCPVAALKRWLQVSGIRSGPLFRGINAQGQIYPAGLSLQALWDIIKARTKAAGLESDAFACHSMRAGAVTQMLNSGMNPIAVAERTGHKSLQTLKGYYRPASPMDPRVAAALGKRKGK